MTKREMYSAIATIVESAEVANKAELLAGIAHEVELLDKKTASRSKVDEQKKEADVAKRQVILDVLADAEKPMTCTEILLAGTDAFGTEVNTSKITYLMKALLEDGSVVKNVDKKKSYYSLAE